MLGIDTLAVDAYEFAGEDVTVLDVDLVVALVYKMDCALIEIAKSAVRELGVSIYAQYAGSLVCFVANEVAADEVHGALREADDGSKLLLEAVGDGLDGDDTLSYDHATRVDAEHAVHVS